MKKKIGLGAVAILASQVLATVAAASSYMPSGLRTSQPVGHYQFCQDNPTDCKARNANPASVKLTRNLWNALLDVNNSINTMIEPVTDMDLWGTEEKWSYPVNRGDCEDYVLLKQRQLEDRGVPASSLLITVVRQKNGAGHAVLTVRTDRGDYVLDNLESNILEWDKTEYRFLKRQSERNASQWVSIDDNRQVIVGSVRP